MHGIDKKKERNPQNIVELTFCPNITIIIKSWRKEKRYIVDTTAGNQQVTKQYLQAQTKTNDPKKEKKTTFILIFKCV